MSKEKATIYDFARMCEVYKHKQCTGCPLNDIVVGCAVGDRFKIHQANKIILKWISEHPVKTRKSEFLKMFPNCELDKDGYPLSDVCVKQLEGHMTEELECDVNNVDCRQCVMDFWDEEVE